MDEKGGAPVQQAQPFVEAIPQAYVVTNATPRGDALPHGYSRIQQRIVCQYCGAEVITATRHVVGSGTHGYALVCCCLGGVSVSNVWSFGLRYANRCVTMMTYECIDLLHSFALLHGMYVLSLI